jgi:predicted glycosyltransferase
LKILVDVTHPAHVHFFRQAIWKWQERGHNVTITTRDKDIAIKLLDQYGFEYKNLGRAAKSLGGLFRELIVRESKIYGVVNEVKPDVMTAIGGVFMVHVGKLMRIPTVVFADTDHATLSHWLSFPFAGAVCTPACFQKDAGEKHHRYQGCHELAYLHPNQFSPNEAVLDELGLSKNEKLFVVRFVSWEAHHDVGHSGFSLEGKRELVKRLSQLGRVIITSEVQLPPDLEPYRMRISQAKIHDVLALTTVYIGESATMASESAVLGTPFIFVSPAGRSYTDEQEQIYGLGYTLSPSQETEAINLALELAQRKDLQKEWQAKRSRLLEDKIDVTAWMVDFVESQVLKI